MTQTFGSQRFRRALESTGASKLDQPVRHGSFYGHAVIARGGQGTVLLGTGDERALSRVCVIKTFTHSDEATLARADRSIRAQLGLMNEAVDFPAALFPRDEQIRPAPWIPDILAWDLDAATPWVAQDFRGPNLAKALDGGLAEPAGRRLRDHRTDKGVRTWLLSQIVSAVEFLHMHGVIHRDLKPENILVERVNIDHRLSESVALCDFDLSKGQGQTQLTQTAVGMGTHGYSAPEQLMISSRAVTTAGDVYSVAMLAIYLFAGQQPWEVMLGSDPTRMQLDPAVAERLGSKREWVEQALSFAPQDRPPLDALHSKLYGRDADS